MGYFPKQLKELEQTINNSECDSVIIGTPIDLEKLLKLNKPAFRVRYWIEISEEKKLREIVKKVCIKN